MFKKLLFYNVNLIFVIIIKHDHIEALNKDQQGIFYDENAYILYAAAVKGTFTDQNTIVSESKLIIITVYKD